MKIYSTVGSYASSSGAETYRDSIDSPVYGDWNAKGLDAAPNWYVMPESSMVRSGNPFFIPDFDTCFQAFPSLCLRIGRLGKSIAPRFASRYIDGWTMAVAVVAKYSLKDLRANGLPWTKAVSFDRSCWLGNLQPVDTLINYDAFRIECAECKISYELDSLLMSKEEVVSLISQYNTLKNGDFVLVGLSSMGVSLLPDTRMRVFSRQGDIELLDIRIK